MYCANSAEQLIIRKTSNNRLGSLYDSRRARYISAPLSSSPIIGDIFDSIVTSMLYSITKSKLATAINLIEFIPFVGDFIPVYTLSTLYWISRELRKPEPDRSYNKGQQFYYPKRNVVKNLAITLKRFLKQETM